MTSISVFKTLAISQHYSHCLTYKPTAITTDRKRLWQLGSTFDLSLTTLQRFIYSLPPLSTIREISSFIEIKFNMSFHTEPARGIKYDPIGAALSNQVRPEVGGRLTTRFQLCSIIYAPSPWPFRNEMFVKY